MYLIPLLVNFDNYKEYKKPVPEGTVQSPYSILPGALWQWVSVAGGVGW